MKKIISLLLAVILSFFMSYKASAQFSADFGYAMEQFYSKLKVGNTYSREDPLLLNGIYAGLSYNWDFAEGKWGILTLQPGIDYTFSFGKVQSDNLLGLGANVVGKLILNDHVINVPVRLRYSYEFIPYRFSAFIFGGPVMSFGLESEVYGTMDFMGKSASVSLELISGDAVIELPEEQIYKNIVDGGVFSIFDLKLSAGLGVIIKEDYEIRASYDFGLLNRFCKQEKDSMIDEFINVNCLRFGFSYHF